MCRYDGLTPELFESLVVDLILFGANQIELIPGSFDDAPYSPHFALSHREMNTVMSSVLAKCVFSSVITLCTRNTALAVPNFLAKSSSSPVTTHCARHIALVMSAVEICQELVLSRVHAPCSPHNVLLRREINTIALAALAKCHMCGD